MMTLLLWITAFLLINLTAAELDHFPEHFVLANRNGNSVTITCRESTSEPVRWKLNDEDVDFDEHFQQEGQNLIVKDVDTPLLGEYSCWRGGLKLSSTFLLLDSEEEEDIGSLLKCRANSYNCNFRCSWTGDRYTMVRLGIGPECSEGQSTCHWVSSSGQPENEGFQFELSHGLSPFAEESIMLKVTAEAIDNFFLLRRTKLFYLREIVVPDCPQIVNTQVVGHQMNVSIMPPSTWPTPHSFFSLEHEIEYVHRDDGRTERSMSSLIPKKISKLRVRSRDPLVLSPWSQWTPWKNVRNPCRYKTKQKSEMSPKCLEHCRRKKEKQRTKDVKQRQQLLK